jgi:SAM-dependent methyltransferase
VSTVFGAAYADAYNSLYDDKDYDSECALIESLFQRYARTPVSSVLDLGCGTGNHSFRLASRGYTVVGVDRSASMLAVAERKLSEQPHSDKLHFKQGDIRNVDLGRRFDSVLVMFAVLGYQLENSDVLSTLKAARQHLSPGGLLIFDVWYGPAVLTQRPSEKIKMIPTKNGRILRLSSGALDTSQHCCEVQFHLWRLEGQRLVAETEETHRMRYFFPLELDLFLERSGFSLVRLGAFPDFDKRPDETTWNVLAVACTA